MRRTAAAEPRQGGCGTPAAEGPARSRNCGTGEGEGALRPDGSRAGGLDMSAALRRATPSSLPPQRKMENASAVAWLVALVALAVVWVCVQTSHNSLTVSCIYACIAGLATHRLVPAWSSSFIKAGLTGKDVNKVDKPIIAESMGFVSATVYLVALFLFIPFPFIAHLVSGDDGFAPTFPHDKLGAFLSALLSLQSMVVLGFADDVFDIRWRYKLILPTIASIPLLMVYYVNLGATTVVVPIPLRPVLGRILDLGALYYVYIGMIAVFCTNSINILAGINGIEAGQSLIIALSVIANDLLYVGSDDAPAAEAHLFSLYFMLPFVGVTLGLLYHNWFPSRVFVGDTYCYFAGMTFAVVGILSHFSKTLLLFFIPQIFNFIYSVPQLFRVVGCPRHRMPKLRTDGLRLVPSTVAFGDGCNASEETRLSAPGRLILQMFDTLGLVRVKRDDAGGIVECNNLTLINLVLVKLGPMSEERLTVTIMVCQLLCSCLAFLVRYRLVHWVYDVAG